MWDLPKSINSMVDCKGIWDNMRNLLIPNISPIKMWFMTTKTSVEIYLSY